MVEQNPNLPARGVDISYVLPAGGAALRAKVTSSTPNSTVIDLSYTDAAGNQQTATGVKMGAAGQAGTWYQENQSPNQRSGQDPNQNPTQGKGQDQNQNLGRGQDPNRRS